MIFLELVDGSFIHLEGCYKLSVQNGEKIILTVCQSSYGWKELDLTNYREYDNEYSNVKHGRTKEDLKTDLNRLIETLSIRLVGEGFQMRSNLSDPKELMKLANLYIIYRHQWMKPALQEEGEVT